MGEATLIEWADSSWNPWRGCREVSQGCDHCYARTEMTRWGQPWEFTRAAKATFQAPLKWGAIHLTEGREVSTTPGVSHYESGTYRNRLVFTCSMSDFFAREADEWRPEAWDIIRRTPGCTYLILTKRPWNIRPRLPEDWGDGYPNVRLGITAEAQPQLDLRLPSLVKVPSVGGLFISHEPAMGPLDLSTWLWSMMTADHQCRVAQVITGGESGGGARPFDLRWAYADKEQCAAAGVKWFMKQFGSRPMIGFGDDEGDLFNALIEGYQTGDNQLRYQSREGSTFRRDEDGGRLGHYIGTKHLKGGDWSEWPADLRVREGMV